MQIGDCRLQIADRRIVDWGLPIDGLPIDGLIVVALQSSIHSPSISNSQIPNP
jgi:hypothetical protein